MDRVPTFAEVGERIRGFREKKKYTQNDLANALGVTRPVVTKIEGGKKAINSVELTRICSFLGCTFEELTKEPESKKLVVYFRDGQVEDPQFNTAAGQIEEILEEIIGQLEIRRELDASTSTSQTSTSGARRP